MRIRDFFFFKISKRTYAQKMKPQNARIHGTRSPKKGVTMCTHSVSLSVFLSLSLSLARAREETYLHASLKDHDDKYINPNKPTIQP